MLDKIGEALLAAYNKITESLLTTYGAPDGRCSYNAWFTPDWDTYADGYKEAADAIVEHAIANHGRIDWYVYPVMFLYRHYLELRVKEILGKCGRTVRRTHSLEVLWRELLPEISKRRRGDQAHFTRYLGERFAEFHRIDQKSLIFRYPTPVSKNEPLRWGEWINLLQVQQVVYAMSMQLDGISSEIDAELEAEA